MLIKLVCSFPFLDNISLQQVGSLLYYVLRPPCKIPGTAFLDSDQTSSSDSGSISSTILPALLHSATESQDQTMKLGDANCGDRERVDAGFQSHATEFASDIDVHVDRVRTGHCVDECDLGHAFATGRIAQEHELVVFTLVVVHLNWSHQILKKRPDALVAGCRKWNVWGTETAFAL
jgi:hypothetical protein